VRHALPEVDVIVLPGDPAGYVAALAAYPWFETASFTAEDAKRTETYRARAEAQELETQSGSLEGFLASLEMRAVVAPFDDAHLPRIVQLIGKTNQFNLTTRRHGQAAVESMMNDPEHVHLYMTLEDRFTNHGLIGLAIGRRDGDVMEIDTLLMSCRVIGRTAENVMVGELARRALEMGCTSLRGIYIPTERNGLVADLYDRLGFEKISQDADESAWEHRLDGFPIASPHITLETS